MFNFWEGILTWDKIICFFLCKKFVELYKFHVLLKLGWGSHPNVYFGGVHIVIFLIKDTNQQTMVAFFNCYVVDFHKKSCTLTSIVCYHSKSRNNIH